MVPVVVMAVFINLPKFAESEIRKTVEVTFTQQFDHVDELNSTHVTVWLNGTSQPVIPPFIEIIDTTELRKDAFYIIYYINWTRLILIGIVPMTMLIYFNYKVKKERESIDQLSGVPGKFVRLSHFQLSNLDFPWAGKMLNQVLKDRAFSLSNIHGLLAKSEETVAFSTFENWKH